MTEWEQLVDAWQLDSWEAYRDVARLGRRTRLPEAPRAVLWSIFERVTAGLKTRGLTTQAGMFTALAIVSGKAKNTPFDFAVVDEAQDITVSHLKFLENGKDMHRATVSSTTATLSTPADAAHSRRRLTGEDSLGPDLRLVGRERSQNVAHQPTGRGGEVKPVRPV